MGTRRLIREEVEFHTAQRSTHDFHLSLKKDERYTPHIHTYIHTYIYNLFDKAG